MNDNQCFAKWDKWLEKIYIDIQRLLINRYIFREVQKIIEANPRIQIASSFYEWMGSVYANDAVIGVRRQVDPDKRSISFARLLAEIRDNPQVLSRSRFVALYKSNPSRGHRDFDGFAGQGNAHVDPAKVDDDLDQLKQQTQNLKKYANRRVAHFDHRALKTPPTFQELDECLIPRREAGVLRGMAL